MTNGISRAQMLHRNTTFDASPVGGCPVATGKPVVGGSRQARRPTPPLGRAPDARQETTARRRAPMHGLAMSSLPKIPARNAGIVLPFLLSVFMTRVISGVSTLLALGPNREALLAWPLAWASSWAIGFPTLLVVLPFVRRLTAALVALPTGLPLGPPPQR